MLKIKDTSITATLTLGELDELREGERAYRILISSLARCFDYTSIKNDPSNVEKITVDVERLIEITKGYALYDKSVFLHADLDTIPIEIASKRTEA